MWILMKLLILLVIFCSLSLLADSKSTDCVKDEKSINWNLRGNKSSKPAENFQSNINNFFETPHLILSGNRTRENLTIFLYALPGVKNFSFCPLDIAKNDNLRRHICVKHIPRNAPDFRSVFDVIMTGCYYFVMINSKGTYWQLDPVYYKTNYNYLDTKLELLGDVDEKPQTKDSPRELFIDIKVPLTCLQVIATLYQFKGKITNGTIYTKDQIINEKNNTEQQRCMISHNADNKTVKTNCGEFNTNITLEVNLLSYKDNEKNRSWTVRISWKKLLLGGNTYYLNFDPVIVNNCIRLDYINSWRPVTPGIFYNLGYVETRDIAVGFQTIEKSDRIMWIAGGFSLAVLFLIAILAYWIYRCYRLRIIHVNEKREECEKFCTNLSKFDDKKSNRILLMYVKGSSSFMNALEKLRESLKQKCNHRIQDVYSQSEWTDVYALGATRWIEEQLNAGSKIVWIDTPQFRSRLNDKNNEYIRDDFRDEAIPHAVYLAKTLFQDATTQYRRHFVVRMKGFEIDDRQDDPLQVVSPYARYHIPENLFILCEHLNGPLKRFENTMNG